MALIASILRLFGLKPQKQSTNPKDQEMKFLETYVENDKIHFIINGDAWEHLLPSEIKAATTECAKEEQKRIALMYERLDAANASARKGHYEPGEDIGTSEIEGFVIIYSPRQMATAFRNLLDHQFDGEDVSPVF